MLLLRVYCSSTGSSRQWPPWDSHSLHMVRLHLVALAMLHMLRVGFTTQAHLTVSVRHPARMGGARIVRRQVTSSAVFPHTSGRSLPGAEDGSAVAGTRTPFIWYAFIGRHLLC